MKCILSANLLNAIATRKTVQSVLIFPLMAYASSVEIDLELQTWMMENVGSVEIKISKMENLYDRR